MWNVILMLCAFIGTEIVREKIHNDPFLDVSSTTV